MNKIQIISEKTRLQTNLFEVRQIKLKGKSGKIHKHDVIYRDPTVHIFPLTNNYELYLVSEYRYLYKKNLLESVAGFVEKDEKPLAAAKRELQEEAGITASQWELISQFYLAASVIMAKVHLFLAKDLSIGMQNLEDDEEIELIKMPLAAAAAKVMQGEIQNTTTAAGILLLDKLRREKKL